jgi:hypothetical protein
MKPIRWTGHALDNLTAREIDRKDVEAALTNPEMIVPESPGREAYMRRYFDQILQQPMLIRAIVEHDANEDIVVTVYKTSKIERYMSRGQP